jgi:hypothetical protein
VTKQTAALEERKMAAPIAFDRRCHRAARLHSLGGIGGNRAGRKSRRIGQVLVEKDESERFDSRRLHHSLVRFMNQRDERSTGAA